MLTAPRAKTVIARFLTATLALLLLNHGLAEVVVRSELSQVHAVVRNQAVEGVIVVENTGSREASVRIYKTDYLFYADGSNYYGEPGSTPRSNSDWIELDQVALSVPPSAAVEVAYAVQVPDADLRGSYWSVIMVEEVTPAADPAAGIAVRTVLRYGVQVVTEFGETGEASLEFTNPVLDGTQDTHVLQVDVLNSGERMLRGEYYVDIIDEAGNRVRRANGQPKRTYPGTSVRQVFTLGRLDSGTYTAIVIGDFGGDDLFGAQYELTISEE